MKEKRTWLFIGTSLGAITGIVAGGTANLGLLGTIFGALIGVSLWAFVRHPRRALKGAFIGAIIGAPGSFLYVLGITGFKVSFSRWWPIFLFCVFLGAAGMAISEVDEAVQNRERQN